jgi:hypothetical protein
MKAYREVALWNSFLASKQDGGDCSASRFVSLPPEKDNPTPIEWETCWSPESVWTFWRGDKFLVPAGILTLRHPVRNLVTIIFSTLTLVVQELRDWKSVEDEKFALLVTTLSPPL